MRKLVTFASALALLGMVAGCSSERHVRTTTTRETIQTAPVDPIVTEQRTTHTETRTVP